MAFTPQDNLLSQCMITVEPIPNDLHDFLDIDENTNYIKSH